MAAAALLVAAAACGGPGSGPAPSGPLFAVLEPGTFGATAYAHDTVAILRPDGHQVARQTFSPRAIPRTPATPVMTPEAVVAAGQVWYADGGGAVRSLSRGGKVGQVTAFPLTSPQQMLSFAVSDDGSRLEGAVFGWPQTQGIAFQGDQPFTFDLYAAAPGQKGLPVRHLEWRQPTESIQLAQPVLEMVGWSADGPLAVVWHTLPGLQMAQPGLFSGPVVALSGPGTPGAVLGGASCNAEAVLRDETVLCFDPASGTASVRAKDGRVLYQLGGLSLHSTALAPDGRHAAVGSTVIGEDGRRAQLPPNFEPEGWLDADAVAGVQYTNQGESDLELIRLGSPGRVVDLGLKAMFVGSLAAA